MSCNGEIAIALFSGCLQPCIVFMKHSHDHAENIGCAAWIVMYRCPHPEPCSAVGKANVL